VKSCSKFGSSWCLNMFVSNGKVAEKMCYFQTKGPSKSSGIIILMKSATFSLPTNQELPKLTGEISRILIKASKFCYYSQNSLSLFMRLLGSAVSGKNKNKNKKPMYDWPWTILHGWLQYLWAALVLAPKHSCFSCVFLFCVFCFFVKLIIVEMVISLSASFHIPSGVLFKAHANHHLEACEHNKGHRRQEDNPKKPPWERIKWKMSSIDWSQHPDNLKPN